MTSPERTQFLRDVLCCAIEGGIGYWSRAYNIVRDETTEYGDYVSFDLVDLESDEASEFADMWSYDSLDDAVEEGNVPLLHVDVDTVRKGIRLILKEDKVNNEISSSVFLGNKQNDAGEIDAWGADAIIQAGVFGEIIYG